MKVLTVILLSILSSVLCADVISKINDSDEGGIDLSDLSIDDRFGEDEDEFPMETQSAQCTITAGDVRASALASTSKKLEGVCGQRDLRRSFEILERKLLDELYTIKLMLAQIAYPNAKIMKNYFNFSPTVSSNYNFNSASSISNANTTLPKPTIVQNPHSNVNITQPIPEKSGTDNNKSENTIYFPTEAIDDLVKANTPPTKPITKPITKLTVKPNESINFPTLRFTNNESIPDTTEFTTKTSVVMVKSLETVKPKLRPKLSGPRDFEVHRFNNTIISNDETQIFTYFWKMENFTDKLEQNVTEISSPIFTISGLHLSCKGILNHLNRDYLYLKIEPVPYETLLRENTANIILKSGSIFKEIETKQLFRHKIIILDQGSPVPTDLISQEFFNTNSGFMIPMSTIKNTYSKNNSVLVKVIIFL